MFRHPSYIAALLPTALPLNAHAEHSLAITIHLSSPTNPTPHRKHDT